MTNVLPFRPRVLLYRLSLARAKALGVCPAPANDTEAAGGSA